jgi:hypothetical protein
MYAVVCLGMRVRSAKAFFANIVNFGATSASFTLGKSASNFAKPCCNLVHRSFRPSAAKIKLPAVENFGTRSSVGRGSLDSNVIERSSLQTIARPAS